MRKLLLTAAVVALCASLGACSKGEVEVRPAADCTPLSEYETYETVIVESLDEVPESCRSLCVTKSTFYPEARKITDEEEIYYLYAPTDFGEFPTTDVFEYMVVTDTGPDILEEVAQRDLTRLGIYGIAMEDLDPFSQMPHLETLWLTSCKVEPRFTGEFAALTDLQIQFGSITRLGDLTKLTNLQKLDLGDAGLTSIRGIDKLTNLSKLNLEGNHIRNLSPLRTMTQLTALNLSNLNNYEHHIRPDLRILEGMQNLRTLGLHSNSLGCKHLDTLGKLTQLERLSLLDCKLQTVESLEPLTNLQILDLTANELSDITPLSGMTELTWLKLHNNEIIDLSPLASLTKMECLYVGNNPLSDISVVENMGELRYFDAYIAGNLKDISPLRNKSSLKEIDLSGTNAVDVEVLRTNPQIERLDISGTSMRDPSFLAMLPHIKKLCVANCKIDDISPILSLSELESLDISQTNIRNLEGIGKLRHLEKLNISGTKIESVEPLLSLPGLRELEAKNCGTCEKEELEQLQTQIEEAGGTCYISGY